MRSRLPFIASVLLSGTGLAACQLALGIDGLTGGTGGSTASSTGSSKPAASSTSSTGAGASSTTSTSSGGGAGGSVATNTSSSGAGGNDAGDGGDGGPPGSCTPVSGAVVDGSCPGYFVANSLGTSGNLGTRTDPYLTISAALAAHPAGPLYVCHDTFSETVSSSSTAALTIYGGLDCKDDWAYSSSSQSVLNGLADKPALSLASDTATIYNFQVNGATPGQVITVGGSSIGMSFSGTTLSLNSVIITTQDGTDGADGSDAPAQPSRAQSGGSPADGTDCDGNSQIPGGSGGQNFCMGSSVNGGSGGLGAAVAGNDGPGGSGFEPSGTTTAGAGDGGAAAMSGGVPCVKGNDGSAGTIGTSGTPVTTVGSITATGFVGAMAAMGGNGIAGGGGGGGGGAIGCNPDAGMVGGGGGGGGAGGCGGVPGNFGFPGGSSIGLLLVPQTNVALSFASVTISPGAGGDGGKGAAGQFGGAGGLGGTPSGNACVGGGGGTGGPGGPGAGGAGGHSLAVAFNIVGTNTPSVSGLSLGGSKLQPGKGGLGSDGSSATAGPPGRGCTALNFAGSPAVTAPCTVN